MGRIEGSSTPNHPPMSSQALATQLLRAIDFAANKDEAHAGIDRHYAGDEGQRRLTRAEAVLSYLSGAIVDAEPALHQALERFLDIAPLAAVAADAKAPSRPLAAGEVFSRPGAKPVPGQISGDAP